MQNTSVVVIGGGTGSYTVLSGLKKLEALSLKAIVTVTDSGGSSGRLRDEYGILPVGDIRQSLVALAEGKNGDSLLRKLFLYRFDRGDMDGHNFGNLFLTAMTDILGSEEKAIAYTSRVLKIKGEVIPVTNKDIDLVAEYADGSVLVGEANIDEPNEKHDRTSRITSLRVQPSARISGKARDAIQESDCIILGPGDLYSSLLSNFAVGGVKKAIASSRAKFIYVVNIMTKYGQTHGYTAADHVREVRKYAGRTPDMVIINDSPPPTSLLKPYKVEHAFPVVDDLDDQFKNITVRKDILSTHRVKSIKGDRVKRSLVRHDSGKLAKVLDGLIRMKH